MVLCDIKKTSCLPKGKHFQCDWVRR